MNTERLPEFGGRLYKMEEDGRHFYSKLVGGDAGAVKPATAPVPKGSITTALFHSHGPDRGNEFSDTVAETSTRWNAKTNRPELYKTGRYGGDKYLARLATKEWGRNINMYLGAPNNTLKVFNPGKDSVTDLGSL